MARSGAPQDCLKRVRSALVEWCYEHRSKESFADAQWCVHRRRHEERGSA